MDKNTLLAILDQEINLAAIRDSKLGLTKWAIWTAIAGLFWFFINLLEFNASFSSIKLFQYFLVIFLLYHFFKYFFSFKSDYNIELGDRIQDGPRFISFLSINSITIIRGLIETIMVLLFLFTIKIFQNSYILITFRVVYVLALISFIFLLVIRHYDFPIPSNKASSKKQKNIFGLLSVLAIVSFYLYFILSYLQKINFQNIDFISLKMSLILWAMVYLFLTYMVTFIHEDPTILMLKEIRRKLNFEYLDFQLAAKKVDIILYGRRVSDLLSKKIYVIIDLLQEVENIIDKFNNTSLPQLNDVKKEEMYNELVRAESIVDKVSKKMVSLFQYSRLIMIMSPTASDEIGRENNKIKEYQSNILLKTREARDKIKVMLSEAKEAE